MLICRSCEHTESLGTSGSFKKKLNMTSTIQNHLPFVLSGLQPCRLSEQVVSWGWCRKDTIEKLPKNWKDVINVNHCPIYFLNNICVIHIELTL